MSHPLERYREVQKSKHGPNWCLFAARLTAGKLVGLFDPDKHMIDFLRSDWAKGKDHLRILYAWAKRKDPRHLAYFNDVVLPAAAFDPSAGVANPVQIYRSAQFKYITNPNTARVLLAMRVPLVTAVDLAGTSGWKGWDHFGVLTKSYTSSDVWFIDPYPDHPGNQGVHRIATLSDPTLKTPSTLEMTADTTTIPPSRTLFGYFQTKQGAPLMRIRG